jgi:hypothetical protein
MAVARYVVVRDRDQWRINHEGNLYGYYATTDEATNVAIETAAKAGAIGYEAQVLIEVGANLYRKVWTHGVDPAPAGVRGPS